MTNNNETAVEETWETAYGEDISLAESELWELELGMSFDDHEEIWRWQLNDMSATLLKNIRGKALTELCDPDYVMPEKTIAELKMADMALANTIGWIRDVQEEGNFVPVEVRRRALYYIDQACRDIDAVSWLIFFGYVVAKRNELDLNWNDYRQRTSRIAAFEDGKTAYQLWRQYYDSQLGDVPQTPGATENYPLDLEKESEISSEEQPDLTN